MVDNEGIRPDLGMVAGPNRAEQNGIRADELVMPDVGVPPAAVLSRPAWVTEGEARRGLEHELHQVEEELRNVERAILAGVVSETTARIARPSGAR